MSVSPGAPEVFGWEDTELLSTAGFRRHTFGTTIDGGAIAARTAYWKKYQ
ncbi:MAG: hypothetical protein ACE5I7_20665 [Candidatus Binatia bacterium]